MRLEHFSTGAMMELWKPLGARPRHWGLDLWAQEQTQSRARPKGPAWVAPACLNVPMSPWGDPPVLKGTDAGCKHRALPQPQQQQPPRPCHVRLKIQSPVLGTSAQPPGPRLYLPSASAGALCGVPVTLSLSTLTRSCHCPQLSRKSSCPDSRLMGTVSSLTEYCFRTVLPQTARAGYTT